MEALLVESPIRTKSVDVHMGIDLIAKQLEMADETRGHLRSVQADPVEGKHSLLDAAAQDPVHRPVTLEEAAKAPRYDEDELAVGHLMRFSSSRWKNIICGPKSRFVKRETAKARPTPAATAAGR